MHNSRRYRMNAAECLLAAKICQSENRSLLLALAALWHALASHEEAINELLASRETIPPANEIGRLLSFPPTSQSSGSLRPRDRLRAGRHRHRGADLVFLSERRAVIDGSHGPRP
jgi:hypothetical protein